MRYFMSDNLRNWVYVCIYITMVLFTNALLEREVHTSRITRRQNIQQAIIPAAEPQPFNGMADNYCSPHGC